MRSGCAVFAHRDDASPPKAAICGTLLAIAQLVGHRLLLLAAEKIASQLTRTGCDEKNYERAWHDTGHGTLAGTHRYDEKKR